MTNTLILLRQWHLISDRSVLAIYTYVRAVECAWWSWRTRHTVILHSRDRNRIFWTVAAPAPLSLAQ